MIRKGCYCVAHGSRASKYGQGYRCATHITKVFVKKCKYISAVQAPYLGVTEVVLSCKVILPLHRTRTVVTGIPHSSVPKDCLILLFFRFSCPIITKYAGYRDQSTSIMNVCLPFTYTTHAPAKPTKEFAGKGVVRLFLSLP